MFIVSLALSLKYFQQLECHLLSALMSTVYMLRLLSYTVCCYLVILYESGLVRL